MRHSLIYIIDMIQVFGLAALALVCIIGAIVNKAWWHLGTAAMLLVLVWASWKDAKNELKDMQGPFPIGNDSEEDLE